MFISQDEMAQEKIPLAYRDYCAHLLPALNKCRIATLYAPWECKLERIAWHKCQYDDYQRRIHLKNVERQNDAAFKKDQVKGHDDH